VAIVKKNKPKQTQFKPKTKPILTPQPPLKPKTNPIQTQSARQHIEGLLKTAANLNFTPPLPANINGAYIKLT